VVNVGCVVCAVFWERVAFEVVVVVLCLLVLLKVMLLATADGAV